MIAGNFMDTVDAMAFHRTVTHSITFALVVSPLLGFALKKIHKNLDVSWMRWTCLFFLGFVTHALLDCFTTWGTQIFWPFNQARIAFKSIFVIDPLYTIPLLICLIWLMFLPRQHLKRRRLNILGLSVSTGYLLLTLLAKNQANQVFESSFARQNLTIDRYSTRPAPFSIILWTVNAETENGYYIGYYSFLDKDQNIEYAYYPKDHDQLTQNIPMSPNIRQLINLSDGWFTIDPAPHGIIYHDLRFGQLSGWQDTSGEFVFSYRIVEANGEVQVDEINKEIGDGMALLGALWKRILGN
ncbi:MAG: metal-dependent hydrolase [Candidatus Cyclobacteriaceae bacterium M3_2C_046]